jgi:DNA-binding response OmpR family regulator
MNEAQILVVDDEPTLSEVISYNLRQAGYVTVTAADADEALRIFKEEKPDLILLDVMLPQGSGFDVCRLIRQQGSNVPIIMLTARIAESDRVLGFELGADDYILKPFATRDLIARVKALLRRSRTTSDESPATDLLVSATLGMTIDTDKRSVSINGSEVRLSRKEFEVLALMVTHPGRVFERSVLLERIWGGEAVVDERTVDVHIRWLREKIEPEPSKPVHLLTLRGIGYKFQP